MEELSDEDMDERDIALQAANNVQYDAETEAIMKKYSLDKYDEEEDGPCFVPPTFYKSGDKDPFLGDDGEEDEDLEDLRIRSTDAILVTATTEEDQFSHVNVYVYEAAESNLYIHHDIVLSSFPLCVEWMEFHPPSQDGSETATGTRNCLAVGTFNPEIEIWDLDLLDALVPTSTLGGVEDVDEESSDVADYAKLNAKQRKQMQQKMLDRASKRSLRQGSHTDAVMCLSWNCNVPNVLASGSADRTLKIWNMDTQQCVSTYSHHKEKVQACCWHPTESKYVVSSLSVSGTHKVGE
jgi:periodic tryptophan protein 1